MVASHRCKLIRIQLSFITFFATIIRVHRGKTASCISSLSKTAAGALEVRQLQYLRRPGKHYCHVATSTVWWYCDYWWSEMGVRSRRGEMLQIQVRSTGDPPTEEEYLQLFTSQPLIILQSSELGRSTHHIIHSSLISSTASS